MPRIGALSDDDSAGNDDVRRGRDPVALAGGASSLVGLRRRPRAPTPLGPGPLDQRDGIDETTRSAPPRLDAPHLEHMLNVPERRLDVLRAWRAPAWRCTACTGTLPDERGNQTVSAAVAGLPASGPPQTRGMWLCGRSPVVSFSRIRRRRTAWSTRALAWCHTRPRQIHPGPRRQRRIKPKGQSAGEGSVRVAARPRVVDLGPPPMGDRRERQGAEGTFVFSRMALASGKRFSDERNLIPQSATAASTLTSNPPEAMTWPTGVICPLRQTGQ